MYKGAYKMDIQFLHLVLPRAHLAYTESLHLNVRLVKPSSSRMDMYAAADMSLKQLILAEFIPLNRDIRARYRLVLRTKPTFVTYNQML